MSTPDNEAVLPIRRLLIGACGAIGVAHLPEVVVFLKTVCPDVDAQLVLTRNAARLVSAAALSALTRRRTLVDWSDAEPFAIPHVELSEWAELLLVMPASANVLGKAAHGIADDLLTSCLLAATCPIVYVPSMSARMWQKAAVQRNVARLRRDGAYVIDPDEGVQATTGKRTMGAMPPFTEILKTLARVTRGN